MRKNPDNPVNTTGKMDQASIPPVKRSLRRSVFIPPLFRVITLAAAFIIIVFNPLAGALVMDTHTLLIVTSAVALLVCLPSLVRHPAQSLQFSAIMVGAELALCAALLFVTGAEGSPFLLYSITPVLTSALFLSQRFTLVTGALSILAVAFAGFLNPFYQISNLPLFSSHLSLYIVVICLTATLPYLINANYLQRLEHENILAERRRLSRDIHDGVAQTLHALCWQVQILRHLSSQGKNTDTALEKLDSLAQKARKDILESLQILRQVGNSRDLRTVIKETARSLQQESSVDIQLNLEEGDFRLDSRVELEVMRICQEALANIRKHSGARTVHVGLRKSDSHCLELTIQDDGRGFDARDYFLGKLPVSNHHGLTVMQERAQSINGRFKIMSMPDRGTEIKLEVPCQFN
jgi:signal transduction histidine kinase